MECRKEQKVDSYGSLGNGGAPLRGLEISDSVVEGVLICLEELLKKCHLGSVNQVRAPSLSLSLFFFSSGSIYDVFFVKYFPAPWFTMVINTLCF